MDEGLFWQLTLKQAEVKINKEKILEVKIIL
jgi:hypothetical protein